MQAFYAAAFDREMGCTEREWLGWLPNALGVHPYQVGTQSLTAQIGDATLELSWRTAEPRAIGLARIPRLLVSFRFAGLDDAQRHQFMKRFDLYMQRGGG